VTARTLPDASRLLDAPASAWAELRARLRASGLDAAWLGRVLRVGERVDDAMRAPMRLWTLRRAREPAAAAARMLVVGDPVPEALARQAIGDASRWIDAGLLARADGGLVSPFRLGFAFDRAFFSDDLAAAGDAVMGPSATTLYACLAARPASRVDALLDVGCGAGAIAIALADRAARVVATDVSERALVLAEANARLNGVTNVELRRGDLFEPVRGERFDRVVSQPPFVARAPGQPDAPFLFGGARGDELALALLGGVVGHLAEGGHAVVLVDFPVVRAEPIEVRVARAAPDVRVLVVASPPRSLEDHCALHAAAAHPALGPDFARAAIAMRDHLDAQRIEGLRLSVCVLERGAPSVALVSVSHFADSPPNDDALDRMVRARALLAAGDDALLDAPLRIAPGTRLERSDVAGAPPVVIVRPPRDRLLPATTVDARVAACAESVGAARSARAAGVGAADVRDALARGLLEPAD